MTYGSAESMVLVSLRGNDGEARFFAPRTRAATRLAARRPAESRQTGGEEPNRRRAAGRPNAVKPLGPTGGARQTLPSLSREDRRSQPRDKGVAIDPERRPASVRASSHLRIQPRGRGRACQAGGPHE